MFRDSAVGLIKMWAIDQPSSLELQMTTSIESLSNINVSAEFAKETG